MHLASATWPSHMAKICHTGISGTYAWVRDDPMPTHTVYIHHLLYLYINFLGLLSWLKGNISICLLVPQVSSHQILLELAASPRLALLQKQLQIACNHLYPKNSRITFSSCVHGLLTGTGYNSGRMMSMFISWHWWHCVTYSHLIDEI